MLGASLQHQAPTVDVLTSKPTGYTPGPLGRQMILKRADVVELNVRSMRFERHITASAIKTPFIGSALTAWRAHHRPR